MERDNLQRRLGNIANELGSFYMKQARGELSKAESMYVQNWRCIYINVIAEAQSNPDTPKEKLEALFAVSLTFLENGIKAFKVVNDEANLALLYSNTGRLMRLMAHYYSEEHCPLNKAAKAFYKKVIIVYIYYSSGRSIRLLTLYVLLFVGAQ